MAGASVSPRETDGRHAEVVYTGMYKVYTVNNTVSTVLNGQNRHLHRSCTAFTPVLRRFMPFYAVFLFLAPHALFYTAHCFIYAHAVLSPHAELLFNLIL